MYSRKALQDSNLPDYMKGSIQRYIENGIPPGDFLTGVITNDLKKACWHADDTNKHLLYEYMYFFYNYSPESCQGSREAFKNWLESGGLVGQSYEIPMEEGE